ncbi:transposase family protein [Streptomyces sp. YIM S03343]
MHQIASSHPRFADGCLSRAADATPTSRTTSPSTPLYRYGRRTSTCPHPPISVLPAHPFPAEEVGRKDLLLQLVAVRVEKAEVGGGLLRIAARTRDDASAVCPGCGTELDWVHSRYMRHVADEVVGARAVVIDLSVRRLYCENPDCPRPRSQSRPTG